LEADLVLQIITALFFSSSLVIVFILFWFFFLGVLGGWWKRGGELVARRVVCQWEWVDGIVVPVTKSLLLYTFLPFWGRDADGVFLSFLSSQSTWGGPLFPPFFSYSLFYLLASQVGLFPL
jgi:hypothetical protein